MVKSTKGELHKKWDAFILFLYKRSPMMDTLQIAKGSGIEWHTARSWLKYLEKSYKIVKSIDTNKGLKNQAYNKIIWQIDKVKLVEHCKNHSLRRPAYLDYRWE